MKIRFQNDDKVVKNSNKFDMRAAVFFIRRRKYLKNSLSSGSLQPVLKIWNYERKKHHDFLILQILPEYQKMHTAKII